MIAEIIQWVSQQDFWVEPLFKFVVTIAAIKYVAFG